MPLHFEQQNPTTTFFLAGLPENGHSLLPAFVLPTKPFKSEAAFLAHFPQQTLKTAVSSGLMALSENGHLSLTGLASLVAAKENRQSVTKDTKIKNFFMLLLLVTFVELHKLNSQTALPQGVIGIFFDKNHKTGGNASPPEAFASALLIGSLPEITWIVLPIVL